MNKGGKDGKQREEEGRKDRLQDASPETQVWWVKVLLTWCAASERVRGSTILDI